MTSGQLKLCTGLKTAAFLINLTLSKLITPESLQVRPLPVSKPLRNVMAVFLHVEIFSCFPGMKTIIYSILLVNSTH